MCSHTKPVASSGCSCPEARQVPLRLATCTDPRISTAPSPLQATLVKQRHAKEAARRATEEAAELAAIAEQQYLERLMRAAALEVAKDQAAQTKVQNEQRIAARAAAEAEQRKRDEALMQETIR
jgi:hypothetical protein